jgi:hypothetical protein
LVTTVRPPSDAGLARRERRAQRLRARSVLWDVARVGLRVRDCGRSALMPDGAARVRATGTGDDRRAGFAGLETCGSVWACPVCAEKILSRRQCDIAEAIDAWTATGGRTAMVTLTMRHRQGQRLADLWDALSVAWNRVTAGRGWADLQERYGTPMQRRVTSGRRRGQVVTEPRIGYARVVETTHGVNGWHVHAHVLLFLAPDVTDDGLAHLSGRMFDRWSAGLVSRGLLAPTDLHGVDARFVGQDDGGALGDYFAKGNYSVDASRAALETARGDLKLARSGNRTPFRILADLVELGVADDLDLWSEWERASYGRRQLTWSTGFREFLGLGQEATDEEVAAEEAGTADDDLVELPAGSVRFIAKMGLHALLLDLAESDDTGAALRRWLAGRGIPFRDVGTFVG